MAWSVPFSSDTRKESGMGSGWAEVDSDMRTKLSIHWPKLNMASVQLAQIEYGFGARGHSKYVLFNLAKPFSQSKRKKMLS